MTGDAPDGQARPAPAPSAVRRAADGRAPDGAERSGRSRRSDLQPPGAPIGLGALNLTLGGDLCATKEPDDQLRLIGAVNTVRGTYDFQGRRFEILRDGTVRFDGGSTSSIRCSTSGRERVIQAVDGAASTSAAR